MTPEKDWLDRESELEEINRLARDLNYIDGDDRTVYDNLLASYFPGVTSARNLKGHERSQWLTMLRLWRRGIEITTTTQGAIDEELAQRRTA